MADASNGRTTWRDDVKFWLQIILIVVTVATSFAVLQAQVAQNTRGYTKLEQKIETTDTTLLAIQVQLAEIQRDILYIRERMAEGGKSQ